MPVGLFDDSAAAGVEPPAGLYAQVAVERGVDRPEGYTYAVPAALQDLAVGERVIVPLGRGSSKAEGIVLSVLAHEGLPEAVRKRKLKAMHARTGVRLPARLVELGRWMSLYYCCPIGTTLAGMLPSSVKKRTGRVVREELVRTGAEPIIKLPPQTQLAWGRVRQLPADVFPLQAKELAHLVEIKGVAPLNRLVAVGLLKKVQTERTRARALPRGSQAVIGSSSRAIELNPAQHHAVDAVTAAEGFRTFLLHGVTGSGKTEVYLRAIDAAVQAGKSALVLVPEISLTPQLTARFVDRFSEDAVAVLHSGLTAAQRRGQWSRVASGEARIVVGARSALFAPFPDGVDLGLVVVDEEHDGAYKQQEQPRHHGRDVAIKLAHLAGCSVLLGSATPSLESWRNAREGRYTLLSLPSRAGGAQMPLVRVVDLAEEMRLDETPLARRALLGPRLRLEIARALDAGGQILLLLNRRGYAGYVACTNHKSCGWVQRCDHCDASLVRHKTGPLREGYVRCHHCLATQRIPKACPDCGSRITSFGPGSQRIEEELPALFPELIPGETLLRLDSDSMRTAQDYFDAIDAFGSGQVRALVGTQMLAKGLDFPNVRLVGVLNADTGLHTPDFRAAERTFQLVSQVAGRAGRGSTPGLVVVQTFNPVEPAIELATQHEYVRFADAELELRRGSGLPPATRMARVVCRHEIPVKADSAAGEIASILRGAAPEGVRVDGPMPCPIARIADRTRIGIEVTAPTAVALQQVLGAARSRGLLKSDYATAVDVDPLSLM